MELWFPGLLLGAALRFPSSWCFFLFLGSLSSWKLILDGWEGTQHPCWEKKPRASLLGGEQGSKTVPFTPLGPMGLVPRSTHG